MAKTVAQQIYGAFKSRDVALVRRLLKAHPELRDDNGIRGTWLHTAAKSGLIEMAEMLLEIGCDVNACTMPEEQTPLISAIDASDMEMARFLLSRGADPNLGRPLIAAISLESDDLALDFVKLLVDHGANVNRVFQLYDSPMSFSALSWASGKTAIEKYLRSKGAK